jgi:hypothetical protein
VRAERRRPIRPPRSPAPAPPPARPRPRPLRPNRLAQRRRRVAHLRQLAEGHPYASPSGTPASLALPTFSSPVHPALPECAKRTGQCPGHGHSCTRSAALALAGGSCGFADSYRNGRVLGGGTCAGALARSGSSGGRSSRARAEEAGCRDRGRDLLQRGSVDVAERPGDALGDGERVKHAAETSELRPHVGPGVVRGDAFQGRRWSLAPIQAEQAQESPLSKASVHLADRDLGEPRAERSQLPQAW